MSAKKYLFYLFVLVALIQLYVAASVILGREKVIRHGELHRFRTAPIDPNDPFRGKYIVLDFDSTQYKPKKKVKFETGEKVYVTLNVDKEGFSWIKSVYKKEPEHETYLTATVDYVLDWEGKEVMIAYPFDRFYMEESKAPVAERLYFRRRRNPETVAYAEVRILNGESVLTDVKIDGVSIVTLSSRAK